MNDRRRFLRTTFALTGTAVLTSRLSAMKPTLRPLIVSTWPFGKQANEVVLSTIQEGGTTLDGVEQGIRSTESSGNSSVGLSGKPNAAGFAQLDACIMHGLGASLESKGSCIRSRQPDALWRILHTSC